MSASRSARERGTYRVRGLELTYHRWGAPEAPPLVFIHGFQDHGESFGRVAAELAQSWSIIAPDLRGHGRSGWVGAGGDYHFYDYVFDVLALVEHLRLERFVLVGHSMGGNVSTYASALLGGRVSALVLLEGMGFQGHDLADTVGRLQRWSTALRREGINLDAEARRRERKPMATLAEAADRLRRYNVRLDEAHALELAETFTEPTGRGEEVVWRFDPLHKTPSAKPYLVAESEAIWRALEMPVLSLYGSESPWLPPDLTGRLACLRRGRSGIVEAAGHNLHHDRPELLARTIAAFASDPETPFPQGVRAGVPVVSD